MKKKWINPKCKKLDVKQTSALSSIQVPGNSTCMLGLTTWPSGMLGPTWNRGEIEWQCSSMGQGAGVNDHLSDGDINKIPRCPYIAANNKTCLAGQGVQNS